MSKVKKVLSILLVILFVATVTSVAVDAWHGGFWHGFGSGIGGYGVHGFGSGIGGYGVHGMPAMSDDRSRHLAGQRNNQKVSTQRLNIGFNRTR
jgi:hypothetical protein